MEDRTRLHIIEQELDNTGPDSPFRSRRQRLNREKKRILRRLGGRDPKNFAGIGKGGIHRDKMELYRIKRVVVNILDLIEGG